MVTLNNGRQIFDFTTDEVSGTVTIKENKRISDMWGTFTENGNFNYSELSDGTVSKNMSNITKDLMSTIDSKISNLVSEIKAQVD